MRKNTGKTEIGDLPDSVMSRILSGLPMEDAVRTSVLSKGWRYRWTLRHEYAFVDASFIKNESKRRNFASFVERAIRLSQNLETLRFHCRGKYDFERWITAALCRNVCNLLIYGNGSFVLPHNLRTFCSLRKLQIDTMTPCTLEVSGYVCFPYLVDVDLSIVRFSNEHSDHDEVEFDFPVLEELKLVLCEWLNIKSVKMHAPKLTSLALIDSAFDNNTCWFQINADELVKLEWYAHSQPISNIAISGLDNVVYASLQLSFGKDADLARIVGRDDLFLQESGLQLRGLLQEFSSLKELALSCDEEEVLGKSILQDLPLPTYYKMEQLTLNTLSYIEVLLELLRAAPYLKILVIRVEEDLEEYDFDAEESVPSCIVSHLEKVTITAFNGKTSEINLIKYFLKNASQLKSLLIQPHSFDPEVPEQLRKMCPPAMPEKERYAVSKELSTYPKASACASLIVEGVKLEEA